MVDAMQCRPDRATRGASALLTNTKSQAVSCAPEGACVARMGQRPCRRCVPPAGYCWRPGSRRSRRSDCFWAGRAARIGVAASLTVACTVVAVAAGRSQAGRPSSTRCGHHAQRASSGWSRRRTCAGMPVTLGPCRPAADGAARRNRHCVAIRLPGNAGVGRWYRPTTAAPKKGSREPRRSWMASVAGPASRLAISHIGCARAVDDTP